MAIICFLGPDCCGKNSLMHELSKLYDYRYFMMPRSPICNIVYDRLFDRNLIFEPSHFTTIETLINSNCYFVLVKVSSTILSKRAIARNEQHVTEIQDFKKHIAMYKNVFNECKEKFKRYEYRFLEIDNSKDLKKTALKLKSDLKEVFLM